MMFDSLTRCIEMGGDINATTPQPQHPPPPPLPKQHQQQPPAPNPRKTLEEILLWETLTQGNFCLYIE